MESNGIIIVDSTRRGKRMPDALSKTVPIWCSVINKAIFNSDDFFVPPQVVSEHEKSQIYSLIPLFVQKLITSNALNIVNCNNETVREKIKKPLRPIWITPDTFDQITISQTNWSQVKEFYPIICCTSSRNDRRPGYVQGAADDHEGWAPKGFNSEILWNNLNTFADISLTDESLHDKIYDIIQKKNSFSVVPSGTVSENYSYILPSNIAIGIAKEVLSFPVENETFTLLINMSENEIPPNSLSKTIKYLHFPTPKGKKGSKTLRQNLPTLISSIQNYVDVDLPFPRTLVICDTGSDISVGVCLVLLCLFPPKPEYQKALNKEAIRQRLVWITSQRKVNPSRSTLTSVNSYLIM